MDVLGRYVEWVPVCPEVEAGLGVPRPPMQLTGSLPHPRLTVIESGDDRTGLLTTFAARRVDELGRIDLAGYVFKRHSPSCGIERVPVYNRAGTPRPRGVGLFARACIDAFPLLPVEDEGRLADPEILEGFLLRVFAYHRWRGLLKKTVARRAIVEFHTAHQYLLLAHSRPHYHTLGRLIAQADRRRPRELAMRYGRLFMEALAVKATVRRHVNVLRHILGFFKARLDRQEKAELLNVVDEYRHGLTPLIVPLTLVKHYVRAFNVSSIRGQVYLNPHPEELMLRNHVSE